jgi:hypothetical protein
MRISFSFLASVFVCALMTTGALAQSQKINARQPEQLATIANAPVAASANVRFLSASQTMDEIARAKSLLKSQPTTSAVSHPSVTLAALDPETSEINLFSVNKDAFLVKGADLQATTQLGRSVLMHVIRANGVNTAVTVKDTATGNPLTPLAVAYPIIRKGAFIETAYYTSTHPALLSPAVVSAGENYVATKLHEAAERLAADGVTISPDILQIAEHLCIVEHTDHQRFLHEDNSAVFPEVLSLYALNQGETFRYSISTAGAGGMIQMIPKTYEGIRQHHPNVGLDTDFERGMSDHINALEAMLLYINETWNYLQGTPEAQDALRSGIATQSELLAAGYNSNPMRLPSYLKNGGTGWRTLIPAETQLYLAIYGSLDRTVDLKGEPTSIADSSTTASDEGSEPRLSSSTSNELVSWINNEVVTASELFLERIFH